MSHQTLGDHELSRYDEQSIIKHRQNLHESDLHHYSNSKDTTAEKVNDSQRKIESFVAD